MSSNNPSKFIKKLRTDEILFQSGTTIIDPEWQSYTSALTSSVAPDPVLLGGDSVFSEYSVVGKTMTVKIFLNTPNASTAGGAGGLYAFSLPPGVTYNESQDGAVGSVRADVNGTISVGTALFDNNTIRADLSTGVFGEAGVDPVDVANSNLSITATLRLA